MNDEIAAKQFIEVGFWSLLLAVLVMVLEAVSGSFAYTYWATVGLTGLTLAFTVGAIVGLGLLILVAVVAYLALRAIARREENREHIALLQAQALLRERQPAPYVVEERPIVVNRPVAPEAPETIGGVPVVAWEYFVTQLCRGVPFTENHWQKFMLPGGYEIASFESYSHLVDPLVELGFIVDRDGERRKSGHLSSTDKDAIMRALRDWERRGSSPK